MIEKKLTQIKSKSRISEHGEVFTADREVNAMLDMVKQETDRIDSRFLEPACGTGNFLIEILRRKLSAVEYQYKKSQADYEQYAVLAASSIYGIDLLKDNVEECRNRLFNHFNETYTNLYKGKCSEKCKASVNFIFQRNIIKGDALTLQSDNGPIVFSEWSVVNKNMIKRRDYTFQGLLQHERVKAMPLFSDLGDDVFIPEPVKDFPLIHYLKLGEFNGD